MPCSFRYLLPRGRLASIGLPCALLILVLLPSPIEAEQVLTDRIELRYDQRPSRVRTWRGKIQRRRSTRRRSVRRSLSRRRSAFRIRSQNRERRVASPPATRRPTVHRSVRARSGSTAVRSSTKKSRRPSARLARSRTRTRSTGTRSEVAQYTSPTTPRTTPQPSAPRDSTVRAQRTREPKPARTPKPKVVEEKKKIEKPVVEAYQPNSPWLSANRWRGLVRRRIAEESPGLAARTEIYPNLGMLLRSLPDDGEVRVRNGIYVGRNAYPHEDRLPEETRNVQVECWLHGVRQDTTNLKFEGNLELLVGTTDDPMTARFMIAEIPAGRDLPGEPGTFEPVRRQLRVMLGSYSIGREFKTMIPTHVIVEGSLFFDGWRTLAPPTNTTGPSAPRLATVWEIQPVVSIEGR